LAQKPDLAFLLAHPAHFFALGCGSGLAPKAPGTFGTLFAWITFVLFHGYFGDFQLLFLLAAAYLAGIWFIDVTGKAIGDPDHGSIVWDEIVAMMLVLEYTPHTWPWWGVAFVLFRLFDIWKPFPIRQCDARLKGGFGVMFDDLLAAIYAIVALKALLWLTMHF
jgi:phosphatidylglycerophosphatase A